MSRLAGLALIVVAVLVLLFYFRDDTSSTQMPADAAAVSEADVHGENVLFNQLHADGTLHYRLRAASIRQFNSEELTRMTMPQLHLANPDQTPWDISANHGYIRKRMAPGSSGSKEEVVYLREAVELEQTHPVNGHITLRADTFYIYPDRQYAETDQDVMIDTEVGRTRAAGLQADLETGMLKLSSTGNQRVHTIVLPEQFKKQ